MKQIQGKPFTYSTGEGDKRTKKEGHRLPEFELTDNDIPEIKDWGVGDTITMEIQVTPIRISTGESDMCCSMEDENDDNKKKIVKITSCRLEVRGVDIKGKAKTVSDVVDVKNKKNANEIG